MTRRATRTEGGSLCGWCSSGHHLASATSRGCARYREPSSASYNPACACTHPAHEEENP